MNLLINLIFAGIMGILVGLFIIQIKKKRQKKIDIREAKKGIEEFKKKGYQFYDSLENYNKGKAVNLNNLEDKDIKLDVQEKKKQKQKKKAKKKKQKQR